MTDRSIIEAATRLRRQGEPYLVATVVNVRGTAYRHPGARMILTRFRWVAGSVSGGCLEGDLSSKAWSCTKTGNPVLVTYGAADDADDDVRSAFGLGCDGIVEVLLERTGVTGRIDALEVAARCLRAQRRGAVATVFRTDTTSMPIGARLALVAGGSLEEEGVPFDPHVRELVAADMRSVIANGESAPHSYDTPFGTIEVLIEAILPPPRVFLFGIGHDAVPVAQLARSLGWDVVVCTNEARHATRDRFTMADEILVGAPGDIARRIAETDRAIAMVMNHDLERDRACIAMLLGTDVRAIGVMAGLGDLALGTRTRDPRIHAPTGGTPQEIALALVAGVVGAIGRRPDRAISHRERAGGTATTIAAAPLR